MKISNALLALAGVLSIGQLAAAPAQADGVLSFVVTGDTFNVPYSITNSSTGGETVLGFGITLVSPFLFDTVNGAPGIDNSAPFSVVGGTGATTGYTGPGSFADGSTSIAFTFTNFGVGETFSWLIDVDQPSAATVFGNELIGSTAYADFSNGLRGLGTMQAIMGDPNGAQFVITSFTPTPGIPEPASWAMLLIGFGAVGTAMRRRSALARA